MDVLSTVSDSGGELFVWLSIRMVFVAFDWPVGGFFFVSFLLWIAVEYSTVLHES